MQGCHNHWHTAALRVLYDVSLCLATVLQICTTILQQHLIFVEPDLGPNCLQSILQEGKEFSKRKKSVLEELQFSNHIILLQKKFNRKKLI